MMTPSTLKSYVNARPFRPFRLSMASGTTFEIRHPEMVRIGRSDILVFTLVPDDPDIYDRWETVSLMLIESVSFLEPATTPA